MCLLLFFLSAQSSSLVVVEDLTHHFFQIKDEKWIVDQAEFNSHEPLHLLVNPQKWNNAYYVRFNMLPGSALYVNNKLYQSFESAKVYYVPIQNINNWASDNRVHITIFGPWKIDSFGCQIVAFGSDERNLLQQLKVDTGKNIRTISPIKIAVANFSQIGLLLLVGLLVWLGKSLFAQKIVFVAGSAVRQNRFRSADDNIKLFFLNVLVYSYLFISLMGLHMDENSTNGFGQILSLVPLLVVIYFTGKICINYLSKLVFFDSKALQFYTNNYLQINALFGLAMCLVIVVQLFSFYPIFQLPIKWMIIIFLLGETTYILSYAFVNNDLPRYKLFYIISYICVFEGIPLVVLAKYLFQKGIISS